MNSKIIVTGGAGFIGSALIWGLNNLGLDNILIVDHIDSEGKRRNLSSLKFRDYLDKKDFLEKLLQSGFNNENIDCIFHLGASTSTRERNIAYLIENNYRYSKHLALFAVKKNIRFIYASSGATYGDGSSGFRDDERDLEKLRPLNLYGYSKHWFDLWAKRHMILEKVVGLKYFNVYGPNEYHKGDMRSFVIKAYEQIMESGEVKLFKSYRSEYKDGEQKRDFIYIKDAVEMTLFFFEKRDAGGIYNIGTGEAHSWNELVRAVFKALGRKPRIRYIEMPESLRNQYQYFTKAEMQKLKKVGYEKPCMEFEKAIEDYVCNYLKNKNYLSSC